MSIGIFGASLSHFLRESPRTNATGRETHVGRAAGSD